MYWAYIRRGVLQVLAWHHLSGITMPAGSLHDVVTKTKRRDQSPSQSVSPGGLPLAHNYRVFRYRSALLSVFSPVCIFRHNHKANPEPHGDASGHYRNVHSRPGARAGPAPWNNNLKHHFKMYRRFYREYTASSPSFRTGAPRQAGPAVHA